MEKPDVKTSSSTINVTGIITQDEVETMPLEEFLLWCLSGAKQSHECNLPVEEPEWDELTDEDKVRMLAFEINSIKDNITFGE